MSGVGAARRAPLGVVLAGGSSRRMGRDKAQLRLPDGTTWLEHAVARLEAAGLEVLLADRGVERPATSRLSRRLSGRVDDARLGASTARGGGPAAGLLGAARSRPGRALLALAVDLPAVPSTVLSALCERDGDWVVPASTGADGTRRLQPTCALYRPAALAALARRAAAGELSLRGLMEEPELRVEVVEGLADPRIFASANTPDELEALYAGLRRRPTGR